MIDIDDLIIDLREKSTEHLGFDLTQYEQGSDEWHKARLGVITASSAHCLLPNSKGKYSETRRTYMYELIAEIATMQSKQVKGAPLDWGHKYEPEARRIYSEIAGEPVHEIPFIYSDDMRCGASPDGLIYLKRTWGKLSAIEIKCPYNTEVHLKTVFDAEVKLEYKTQIAFLLWVSGLDRCTFISYDPRIIAEEKDKISVMTYTNDMYFNSSGIFEEFEEEVPKFIEEMDEKLKKLGIEFGQQWSPQA